MRPHAVTSLLGAFAAVLLAGGALAAPPEPHPPHPVERGFPLLQAYVPTVEEAQPQNFGIARDARGVLYAANLGGVLTYDGAWWRAFPIGKERSAFSVSVGAAGRVGVGGVDELGYLAPDARGTLRYVSLLPLLPPAQRTLGQVHVHAVPGGFAFFVDRRLLLWDGTAMTTVATFPGGRPYPVGFPVGAAFYVWTREGGISRLDGRRLLPVPGGERFRGRRVDALLPADSAGTGLLVSVRGEGLFRLAGGEVAPFAPEASRWSAANRVFAGCRLPDGRWALGSILGGLLLLRPDGTVDQVIDTSVGLPGDFIYEMVVDREGALWLALNNGLARVEVASSLSVVDSRQGLKGSVYSMARHQGALWVGTEAGFFTNSPNPGTADAPAGAAERGPRMRAVPGLPPAGWSLLSAGDVLLGGTAFGLYSLRPGPPRLVAGTEQDTIFALTRSAADPERVWLGTSRGLAAVRREGAGWRYEGKVVGVGGEVRNVVESRGVLWSSGPAGIVGFQVPPAGLAPARLQRVPGSDGSHLFRIGDRILVAREEQVERLDETRGALVADPDLAGFGRGGLVGLAEDAAGNLWMSTHPPTVALVALGHGGAWGRQVRSLVEVPARDVETLFAEADGVVWMAAENGLYRYAGPLGGPSAALPAPLLSRLASGDGALLFGGAATARPGAPELPPDVRRLRLEFAPLSSRAGLRYQTRLDPIDADWGAPAGEPFAELTHLPPGDYRFHVRTVGPSHEVGPETAWTFGVRPPWYRTPWALLLWVTVAAGAVYGFAALRGRALAQRAAQLEARVAEQTVELRQTVDELRRAHSELEGANARLEELTLQDELTGVANRRALQQVLAQEWGRALWHRQPIGLILLDLDDFKLLNDTRGHPEGDLCLQRVAGYLADTVGRAGDLVARYGGEEFAVLLPDSDLAAAWQVAEELRAGIETLAIPHPAVAGGHVTASLGLACMTPSPGQRLEVLVEAADLALYRAKKAGKNRVSAGGRTGEITGLVSRS